MLSVSMESCRQQNIKTHRSPDPPNSSLSVSLGPRRVLQETNSNPQIYAPESTDIGQAKPTVFSQHTVASILEQRRKSGAHSRKSYPVQRVQQYQQYRARQRRDAGSEGDPVWPDELEDAFIEGMMDCHTCLPWLSSQNSSPLQSPAYRKKKAIDSS
jgi:hypothetical protein